MIDYEQIALKQQENIDLTPLLIVDFRSVELMHFSITFNQIINPTKGPQSQPCAPTEGLYLYK